MLYTLCKHIEKHHTTCYCHTVYLWMDILHLSSDLNCRWLQSSIKSDPVRKFQWFDSWFVLGETMDASCNCPVRCLLAPVTPYDADPVQNVPEVQERQMCSGDCCCICDLKNWVVCSLASQSCWSVSTSHISLSESSWVTCRAPDQVAKMLSSSQQQSNWKLMVIQIKVNSC